jgi:stage II sporulation protein D
MSFRREHLYFVLSAALVVIVGAAGILNLSAPFARPAPHPKWANITSEPEVNVHMADTGAIQRMKLEKYLEGVVAGEMENTWPLEALKAQAIIARTFTIEQLQRKGGVTDQIPGADVSTDHQLCQAYNAAKVNDDVRRAVEETRGLILTYRGVPVRAWFHADSGGMTATAEEGLGQATGRLPYIRNIRVPWTAPNVEWTATFTQDEVRRAVAQVTGSDPGAFSSVAIGDKGPSGRALTLRIGNATVAAPEFRLAIGSSRMRSTLLTSLTMEAGRVRMTGRGYGHGVGMSQWAARRMAEEGRSAQDIARFFFPGARLTSMWP